MKKKLYVTWLMIALLSVMKVYASYPEHYFVGTENASQYQNVRVEVPSWVQDEYVTNEGYYGGTWSSSIPNALQIRVKSRFYCEIFATSWFPENGEVNLYYDYSTFKYGLLTDV